jgi:hypothetical protein
VRVWAGVTDRLGSREFLRLLVAELQHQNPLEPLKDRDFMVQLAQFSSLDSLHRMETSLASLGETQQALLSASRQILGGLEAGAQSLQEIQASLETLRRIEEHLARLAAALAGTEVAQP